MKVSRFTALTLALTLTIGDAAAQEGNGLGNAYVATDAAVTGGFLTLDYGSPGLAFGTGLMSISDGFGPSFVPGIGQLFLDVFSPNLLNIPLALDANGEGSLVFPVPNDPALVALPAWYMYVVIVDPNLPPPSLSISKTVRLGFANADGYQLTNLPMAQGRALHSADTTSQGPRDNRTKVLVAGGGSANLLNPTATNSTELYWPVVRIFAPGPSMSSARTAHRSVPLGNGLVLVTGGLDETNVALSSCELYDPVADIFIPTGSMSTPRAGHALTLLLNGKVLASGGLTLYQGAASNLPAALNTTQNTAEIYDPATGTWSPVAGTLSDNRLGHSQSILSDGTVLLAGGITGGQTVTTTLWSTVQLPVFTNTCDIYDPVTNTLSAGPSLAVARAFHGASPLGNGDILVTGGMVNGVSSTVATTACEVFDGVAWATTGALPTAVAFHTQFTSQVDGTAVIAGGATGSMNNPGAASTSGRHDGLVYVAGNAVGTNPGLPAAPQSGRGIQTLTRLHDGTYLMTGGTAGSSNALTTAVVYTDG